MRPERVLVVDDDDAIRCVIAAHLADAGFDVCEASTLTDANRILARALFPSGPAGSTGRIDLVVLDLRLAHGESGETLITALANVTNAPAMMLVSASPDLAVPLSREFGVAWVPKPFDLDVLTATARIALDSDARPRRM